MRVLGPASIAKQKAAAVRWAGVEDVLACIRVPPVDHPDPHGARRQPDREEDQ